MQRAAAKTGPILPSSAGSVTGCNGPPSLGRDPAFRTSALHGMTDATTNGRRCALQASRMPPAATVSDGTRVTWRSVVSTAARCKEDTWRGKPEIETADPLGSAVP
jgi:hypothetical protein